MVLFLLLVFGARLMKRANLKHLFPSRSPKPNKFYVSLKLVANWDGFSMKIFSLNHTSSFLCEISSPHTWTKNPLNIGLLAAPLGQILSFYSEGMKVRSGFQSKGMRGVIWWYASDLSAMFLCSRKFRSMVNMVGPQVVGRWKWCHCKYSCCFLFVLWLCQKVLWAFQYGALWSVISGGVSRNSRWFQELYILYQLWTYFLVEKKTQFSFIKPKVSWAWCHWCQMSTCHLWAREFGFLATRAVGRPARFQRMSIEHTEPEKGKQLKRNLPTIFVEIVAWIFLVSMPDSEKNHWIVDVLSAIFDVHREN